MTIDFQTSVVTIFRTNKIKDVGKRTAGAGFVVTEDGLIVTCAHVIDYAEVDEIVYLSFFRRNVITDKREIFTATLLKDFTISASKADVAFLQLNQTIPEGVVALPLGKSANTKGLDYSSFGFPAAKPEDGMSAECRVVGLETENGNPLLQIRSPQVSGGFSGGPVWDENRQCVIGMITSIIATKIIKIEKSSLPVPFDPYGRQRDECYAIPTEVLQEIYPSLQFSDVCPYKGLSVFTEKDASLFFGRDQYIETLLNKLRKNVHFLPIFGPSGSGKSSVVQAGLLPRLRKGKLRGSEDWSFIVTRPTQDPFKQLTIDGLLIQEKNLVQAVEQWFVKNTKKFSRFVLIIDQFEQLFTICSDLSLRQEFIHQLEEVLKLPHVTVILVMRNDFYSQFALYPSLTQLSESSEGATNVHQILTKMEIIEVIQRPAEIVGLRFEDGLIELIIRDTIDKTFSMSGELVALSTMLPLLEVTLEQLWKRRQDNVLTRQAYSEIGGVAGSLSQQADEVYDKFSSKGKKEAQRVLTELVLLGDKNQRPPYNRRILPLSSLFKSQIEDEVRETRQIIGQLTDAKLLITSYDSQIKEEVIEIIHDTLLLEWERIRKWLEEDFIFFRWRQEIEKQAQFWQETKRRKEKLLKSNELKVAINWRKHHRSDLSQRVQEFIQESQNIHQRRLIFGIIISIAVAGGGSSIVFQQVQSELPTYEDITHYTHKGPIEGSIYTVKWSPEASRIASGSADKTVEIHTSDGSFIYAYKGHESTITEVTWSYEGFRLASASLDGTVQIWNAGDEESILKPFIYTHHKGVVLTVNWCPKPKSTLIASGGSDLTAQVWDGNTGKRISTYFGHKGPVNTVCWSPNGSLIASGCGQDPSTGSGDNSVHVWVAATAKTIWTNHGHSSHVISIAWSPNGQYIASAGWDRKVQIISSITGKTIFTYTGHTNAPINSVGWSSDSIMIASASSDRTVRVWKALDGQLLCLYKEHNTAVESVAWSPQLSDKRLVSAGDDKTVRIWQLK